MRALRTQLSGLVRSAVVLRLRRADYVRWCFKAGAAGSQRREDAQGAAGSFALGSSLCLCEAAGSFFTYFCTGGRLRNLHTLGICLCVARAAGSWSKQKGGRLLREKRAAGSFPWSDKGVSLLRQELQQARFALCRKGGRLLWTRWQGIVGRRCRSKAAVSKTRRGCNGHARCEMERCVV